MYLAHMLEDLSDRKLTWLTQLGVEHLVVDTLMGTGIENPDGTWNDGAIKALQDRLATFGLTMDVLTLGLDIRYMARRFPGIMRGLPSRDAEIATVIQRIETAGRAGVPCLKYNLSPLGLLRTGFTPGRGGARYPRFYLEEWTDTSLTEAGEMPAERVWELITYFLKRVVPAAEKARVRLACHPNDPPLQADRGLRGIVPVLSSVEALERFVQIAASDYHGLNFCQGTVAEMCVDPATGVLDAIRRLGSKRKIFMVHFRNIRGGFLRFDEVYPDNGSVDMYRAMRTYREVGYNGIFCADHVPQSDVDPDGERQFSYSLGYMRALMSAVEADGGN